MAFGQISPDVLQAIEIAVRTTGQQAVTDLQTRLAGVTREIEFQKAALRGGAQTQQEFLDHTQDLIHAQNQLTQSVRAANNVMRGVPAGFSLSGQAALSLSYALDDVQYGFSAIVNNAPHIALALGAGPGVAGALGGVFVAANILSKNLPDVGGAFRTVARDLGLMTTPLANATSSLESYQAVVQAISDKPFKIEADYANILTLTREVDAASRAVKELEGLNAQRSEAEGIAHKSIAEGVVESGGGGGRLEDLMIELAKQKGTYGQGSKFQEDIAFHKSLFDAAGSVINAAGVTSPAGIAALATQAAAQNKVAYFQDQMDKEARGKIAETIALRKGDFDARQIADLASDESLAPMFARFKIDPLRLRAGAEGASSGAVREVQKRKVDAERKKDEERALQEQNRLGEEAQRNQERFEKQKQDQADRDQRDKNRLLEEAQRNEERFDKKQQTDAAKAARDAARDARNAQLTPAQQKRQTEMAYGQQFQAAARDEGIPISGHQATAAGRQIAGLVEQGVDVNSAAQQALASLATLVNRQNMQALRNAADWEQLTGIVNGATQQLQFIEMQQRRATINTRTNNVHP